MAADLAADLFRGMPTAHIVIGPDLRILDANDAYLEIIGRPLENIVGNLVFEEFPPDPADVDENGDPAVKASMLRVLATGVSERMPLTKYDITDAETGEMGERWWPLIHFAVRDADGGIVAVSQRTEDVTDLVREQARGDELRARVETAETDYAVAARELSAALRAQDVASRRIASLARSALLLAAAESLDEVPEILSSGTDVVGTQGVGLLLPADDGGWDLLVNPTFAPEVRARYARLPYDSALPTATAARTGRPVLLPDEAAGLAFAGEAMAEVHRATGRVSWAALPLLAGDRPVGAITFSWTAAHVVDADERALLDGYAAQVAQTVERLRAVEERQAREARSRALSEALQHSLLTAPSDVPGLEVAVRYRPAARDAQVGGDWYDVFTVADGTTLLVVGDVSGHDRGAAATMGQVRNLLRGLAVDSTDGPAALLTRLDRALAALGLDALATCVLVAVGTDGRVRWSNAGHPPPLVRAADGTVTAFWSDADPMLGVAPDAPRSQGDDDFPVGSTVVLYTDGLVERRTTDIEEGIRQVADALGDATGEPEQTADALLAAVGDNNEDDVVLLAVRRVQP